MTGVQTCALPICDVITVDFDGVLTEEQLYDVEQEANEAVLRNVPVSLFCA